MTRMARWTCTAILLLLSTTALAQTAQALRLANIFNDHMILQQGKPITIWGWGQPGKKVTVQFAAKSECLAKATAEADTDGKWRVDIKATAASFAPHTITVAQGKQTARISDVLIGELWVTSGQSNMTYGGYFNKELDVPTARVPNFRYCRYNDSWYKPNSDLKTRAQWQPCTPETAGSFAAIPLMIGMRLQRYLNVPVGVINHARGGTQSASWTTRGELEAIAADDAIQKKDLVDYDAECAKWEDPAYAKKVIAEAKAAGRRRMPVDPRSGWSPPAALYNAMVHPLRGLSVAGVFYYQGEGEGNWTERWVQYERVFPSVIRTYRTTFEDKKLPFGIISLAGWGDYNMAPEVSCAWGRFAVIRDIHRRTQLVTPQTGLITIYDTGNHNVHPALKTPVADRSVRWALATVYGKKIEHHGPRFKSMEIKGGKALLTFEMDPYFRFDKGTRPTKGPAPAWQKMPVTFYGYNTKSLKYTGFVIAGKDRRWYPARIKANEPQCVLEATSPFVPEPVAVRYGWACWPDGNAVDHVSRLPMEVFRTDDWPVPPNKAVAAELQKVAKAQAMDRQRREHELALKMLKTAGEANR